MGLKEILKKQGGLNLLKQYWQGGAFFTAAAEFILLGKEKKALEILRLSAQYKIKKNLERKYKKEINEFQSTYKDEFKHDLSNKVWVCWFQGMDQAPELVKKCFESLQRNLTDREIILITSDNMCNYVQFPDFILDKWKNGKITHTHMTDLLRLELLVKYGGMWVDATVLCTSKPVSYTHLDVYKRQVYDQERLKKIRENAYAYFHGHTVGGTNPSLIEALGSTDLNLLVDVGFNKEVAEDCALYWSRKPGNLAKLIDHADKMSAEEIAEMGRRAKHRVAEEYTWDKICGQYENVFTK